MSLSYTNKYIHVHVPSNKLYRVAWNNSSLFAHCLHESMFCIYLVTYKDKGENN